jgi:ankyrin repeat protein
MSAPIVGSSSSTPLHYAAANGHSTVVRTLLLHGAHTDQADKHGVMPKMLARENGKEGTAEVLKEWLANKDQDLREREGDGENGSRMERKSSSMGVLDCLENMVRK